MPSWTVSYRYCNPECPFFLSTASVVNAWPGHGGGHCRWLGGAQGAAAGKTSMHVLTTGFPGMLRQQ
jgi:hypothetical protein